MRADSEHAGIGQSPSAGGHVFEKPEPQEIEILDRQLRCQICSNARFWHRRAQLHGGVATFFEFEWLGPTADCAICATCGYIHWFLPPKE
jgi:hypothetical protein